MDKKLYLAQLAAEAISCYHNEDAICDALWLMNGGLGGAEEPRKSGRTLIRLLRMPLALLMTKPSSSIFFENLK